MESHLDGLRSEIAAGKTRSDVIASMQRRAFTILDAIKATRELFGPSLADAKELVASHPAYSEVAATSAPLQNEIVQTFNATGTLE